MRKGAQKYEMPAPRVPVRLARSQRRKVWPAHDWEPCMKFARKAVLAVISCFVVCVAGEARAQVGIYIDIGTGRFLSAEKAGEQRIRSESDRTTRNLAPLCYAHYKLRHYDRLFRCVANLETRIAAGDVIHSDSMVFSSDAS